MTHRIPAFPYLCLSCLHFLITPGIQNQGILDTTVRGQLCAINSLSDMCFQEVELRSSGNSAVYMLRDFTCPSMITYFLRSITTLDLCFIKVLLFMQSIGKLRNKIFLKNFPPLFLKKNFLKNTIFSHFTCQIQFPLPPLLLIPPSYP